MSRSGWGALVVLQRVDVRHQVATHPVRVNQLLHACGLGDLIVVSVGDIARPTDWLVRNPQRPEDFVVEVIFTKQQFVDALEEVPTLCTLNDPVVVRRGEVRILLTPCLASVSAAAPCHSAGYSRAPAPTIAPWPGMSRGTL